MTTASHPAVVFVSALCRQQRELLLEALTMAASRHESMARAQKFGRPHDEKAAQMRTLRHHIKQLIKSQRPADGPQQRTA